MTVAVLFARADSCYKEMPECDVWDIDRDARKWAGGSPVVAHPPCRAWGRLRTFAKPRKGERLLATWSVRQVRKWGGVLEHPASSTLWPKAGRVRPLVEKREGVGMLTADDVRRMVADKLKDMTQVAVAESMGVSASYLNDYLHFRRDPGPKILEALGLRVVVGYERTGNE